MKIIKLCVLLFAVTVFVSCKQEEKAPDVEVIETKTVEKETVIIKDTVSVAPAEEDGTSVKINSNGIEVKSGDVDVKVK